MPTWCGWSLTFLLVNVACLFFRSPNVSTALRMLAAMAPHSNLLGLAVLKTSGTFAYTATLTAPAVAVGVVLAFWFKTSDELAGQFQATRRTVAVAVALLLLCGLMMNGSTSKAFVYFAF
jgi:hypothetical protein